MENNNTEKIKEYELKKEEIIQKIKKLIEPGFKTEQQLKEIEAEGAELFAKLVDTDILLNLFKKF